MKRFVIPSLAVLAIAGFALSHSAMAVYSDTGSIPANQGAAIDSLTERGLVQGYDDGTYRPTQNVNRAEFLKVLMTASGKASIGDVMDGWCFTDFKGAEQWYWQYACAAKSAGVIDGYDDGTFRGNKYINIAEAMKISANAFEIPLPMYFRAPDHWYDQYMDAVAGKNVFDGVRREPASLMTRAEMAFVIMKLTGEPQAQCDGHMLGETYKMDCNTCTCTENGSACTKMACIEKKCFSSNDCPSSQRCSTEWGDCKSACEPGADICPAVCAGTCENR